MQVFLSLSFDEDLRKPENTKPDPKKMKKKFYKTGRRNEEIKQLPASEKKKNKQEMMSKTREEVLVCHSAKYYCKILFSFDNTIQSNDTSWVPVRCGAGCLCN